MAFPTPEEAHEEIHKRTHQEKPELTDVYIQPDDLVKAGRVPLAEWFVDFGDMAATFDEKTEVLGSYVKTTTIYRKADYEINFLPDNYEGIANSERFVYSRGDDVYTIEARFVPRKLARLMDWHQIDEDLRPIVAERLNAIIQEQSS